MAALLQDQPKTKPLGALSYLCVQLSCLVFSFTYFPTYLSTNPTQPNLLYIVPLHLLIEVHRAQNNRILCVHIDSDIPEV